MEIINKDGSEIESEKEEKSRKRREAIEKAKEILIDIGCVVAASAPALLFGAAIAVSYKRQKDNEREINEALENGNLYVAYGNDIYQIKKTEEVEDDEKDDES